MCALPCAVEVLPGTYYFGASERLIEGSRQSTTVPVYHRDSEGNVISIEQRPTSVFRPHGYHRSKFFTIEPGREYRLTIKPRDAARARTTALLMGTLIPLAAIAPLIVPSVVDMPISHAAYWWAGGGVLASVGVFGAFGIGYGRSKLEIQSWPRVR